MSFIAPYTDVWIDVNQNGVFESGGDISSDVRYISIDRGVDPRQRRASAAALRLEVNNFDHAYSPSNPSSSFAPGQPIRVRSGFPADDFTEASQVALDGHTPTLAGGTELGNWSASSGMEIKLDSTATTFDDVGITSTGTKIATLDYGEANVRVAAEIGRPSLNSSGGALTYPYKQPLFCLRYVDSSNFTYVYLRAVNASTALLLCIADVVSGTDTEIESVTLEDNITGSTYWEPLETAGKFAQVEAYITGDVCQVAIFESGAFAHEFTGLTRASGTRHGIGGAGFTTGTEASVGTSGAGALWTSYGLLTQFYGRIDAIDPQTAHEDKVSFIRAFDEFERLSKFTLFSGSPTPPVTAGDIVSRIVTRSEFTRGSIVDDGTTLTPAAASSTQDTIKVMGDDALAELHQVQDDEVGLAYIGRTGVLHFEAADHREINDHDSVISTWLDTSDQTKYWLPPFTWDDGKEGVENEIFIEYYRSSKVSSQTVWELQPGDDPEFDFTNRKHPDDSSLGVIDLVTIGDSDGVADPKIPVPYTDYTIDENANETGQDWLTAVASNQGTVTMVNGAGGVYTLDDTGQDFTGSTSIAGVSFGKTGSYIVIKDASGNIAIAKTSGDPDGDGTKTNLIKTPESSGAGLIAVDADFSASNTPLTYQCHVTVGYPLVGYEGNFQFLRFIAQDTIALTSAPTAHVTVAKLVGDRITNSDPSAARAGDTTSQSTYGLRRVQHVAKHIADWSTAMGRAEKRLELRKDARERVTVKMQNSTKENLYELLFREVSDRIRIRYDDMSIDRDHFIERYLIEIVPGDQVVAEWELTRVVVDGGLNYRFDDDDAIFDTAVFAAPA